MQSFLLFLAIIFSTGYSFLEVSPSSELTLLNYLNTGNPSSYEAGIHVSFSSSLWDGYSKIHELGFFYEKGAVGFRYYDFGELEYKPNIPDDLLSFTYNPTAYIIYGGKRIDIDKELSFGVRASYFRFEVINEKVESFFGSFGFLYRPSYLDGLVLSAYVDNLAFDTGVEEKFPLPMKINTTFYFPIKGILLSYSYSKIMRQGNRNIIHGFGITHRIGASYVPHKLFSLGGGIFVGDEPRVFEGIFKLRVKNNFFLVYNGSYRRAGLPPVHSFVVEVKAHENSGF